MKLTLSALKGACVEQRTLFKKLFPNGVVPTVELAEKHASVFDWNWAAEHLLSAPAWAEYDRVTAPAWAKYIQVAISAQADYFQVTALARAEYIRVTAVTFVTLWNKEN